MRKLSELLDVHRDFERIFERHQIKLLHFEFDEALAILGEYERALLTHIADEETHLLPIYIERGDIQKGGAAKMFFDEHEKLANHVEFFKDEIAKLGRDDADLDKKLIWLIEREGFFKKLHDHHDIRETQFLYPELDRITSPLEKLELLGKVTCRF
jgi:hemerythrin-like domain-containing protein